MNSMPDTRFTPITGIDAHAHVFSRALDFAGARRYTPDYDATLTDYLAQLATHGLSHGVLVQPSFLGTDNRYLLAALQQAPGQLRGVVVVEPDVNRSTLDEMTRLGVTGIRLNLMGKALPDLSQPVWRSFLRHIAELDWHVELHRQLEDLPGLVRLLQPFGVKVVIDHFGRADARLGLDQPGLDELLTLGQAGRLWMKVSGVYRLGGTSRENLEFAQATLSLLLQNLGPQRLVWGSDWPHTQHEDSVNFTRVVQQRLALGCPDQLERLLLVESPAALFGFQKH